MRSILSTVAIAGALCGCAAFNGGNDKPQKVPASFDLEAVQRACQRLRCREPNTVVADYFAQVARQTGSACVVHIFPGVGRAYWGYWFDYVSPLRGLLHGSRVQTVGFVAKQGSADTRRARMKRSITVGELYAANGAPVNGVKARLVDQAAYFLPPYRGSECKGKPVLEVYEGARIVSEGASATTEDQQEILAERIVLVVIN